MCSLDYLTRRRPGREGRGRERERERERGRRPAVVRDEMTMKPERTAGWHKGRDAQMCGKSTEI